MSPKVTSDSVAIGIDLGTTNSLGAVVIDNRPVTFGNQNSGITPSVIGFESDRLLIGQAALDRMVANPDKTIYSIKRLMGKSAKDMEVDRSRLPFVLAADSRGLAAVKIEGKVISPVELSAAILSEIKKQAEKYLNKKVNRAVITVPAYFDDAQRQATRDAGKIAGLEVLRIINEPTAASLAYGIDQNDRGNIVVYDLGGGTFDISILKLKGGIFEVLSTAGDTNLGGDDFDDAISHFILDKLKIDPEAIDLSPKFKALLKQAAGRAKVALSEKEEAEITIESDGSVRSLDLTRVDFEKMIEPLITKTIDLCHRAIKDASLDFDDIDELILVGGSTRIPMVRREVEKYFKKPSHCDLGPDEVVALGAAIQADILTGGRDDLLLLDVAPLSIGLETMGGIMNVLIRRNSKIPNVANELFTTYVEGQTSVAIRLYQGERELVDDNRLLGSFDLTGIPPQPAGVPRIEVSFTIDADGILKASARDTKSGKKQEITVRPSYGLNREEVDQMVRDSFVHARSDIDKRLFIELSQESERVIAATNKTFENYADYHPGEKEDIEDALEELQEALEGSDPQYLREKLDDLNEATVDLAGRMANSAIGSALKNKTVAEANKLTQ